MEESNDKERKIKKKIVLQRTERNMHWELAKLNPEKERRKQKKQGVRSERQDKRKRIEERNEEKRRKDEESLV